MPLGRRGWPRFLVVSCNQKTNSMAKIAFILLCHKDPDGIIRQARSLTVAGDYVVIHFDARAGAAAYGAIRRALADVPHVAFADGRLKCGWGQFSLVRATLVAARTALNTFPDATHVYLLSEACHPIKTAEYAKAFLDTHDADFIECHDFFRSDWIKTGPKKERLIHPHYFNERRQKRLFDWNLAFQKRFGRVRRPPKGIEVQIGSQWWCLRRGTMERVLDFIQTRRDVMRFFRLTWIPDEIFFQTLVWHLIPAGEITRRSLTFSMFSDYGQPVTFYEDHHALLLGQDALFARKISPHVPHLAPHLAARLAALYGERGVTFQISDEGRALYTYLVGRGRVGRRFAPRAWEAASQLGRDKELLIILCKKRSVAKRLIARMRALTDLPCLAYLFDDVEAELPDLGGLQSSLAKRHRHRRALMRMLFGWYETDRLVICLDPARLEVLQDFCSDTAMTKLLEIECNISDAALAAYAHRAGLMRGAVPHASLLSTIRQDIVYESDQIHRADFANHMRLREQDDVTRQATVLERFLSIPPDRALALARTPTLFAD